MTLKGHGKYGRKLNLAFQISSPTPPPLTPTPEKKNLINSFLAEEKCPDFRFYSLILYGKKIA